MPEFTVYDDSQGSIYAKTQLDPSSRFDTMSQWECHLCRVAGNTVRVLVAVWQPCELLYTFVTYLLTYNIGL